MSDTKPASAPAADRRRSPRYAILQRCLVRPASASPPGAGAERPEGWRCIAHDISAHGIGLALDFRPADGAEFEIEPEGLHGARPVRARVLRTQLLEYAWLAGCELTETLTEAELKVWLAARGSPPSAGK